MNKIERWSKLYDIPERTIVTMLGDSEDSYRLRADTDIAYKIAHRNSQLVQQFVAQLPPPRQPKEGLVTLNIDFLFPIAPGWHQVFEGIHPHPAVQFEGTNEISSTYFRRDGTQLYIGETIKDKDGTTRMDLPTYVQANGSWPEGYRKLAEEWMPLMLEKEFFVYSIGVGRVYNEVKTIEDFSHESVGLNEVVLGYSCKRGFYDLSASVYDDGDGGFERFWGRKERENIQTMMKRLNQTFFSTRNPVKERQEQERFRRGLEIFRKFSVLTSRQKRAGSVR